MEQVVEEFTELLDKLPDLSVRATEAWLEELVGQAVESHNGLVEENQRLRVALQSAQLEKLDTISNKEAQRLRTDLASLQAHREKDQARIKELEKALKHMPELEKRNKAVAKKNREMQERVQLLNKTLAANKKAREAMSHSHRLMEAKLVDTRMEPIWKDPDSIECLVQWPNQLFINAPGTGRTQYPNSPALMYLNKKGMAAMCVLADNGKILIAQDPEPVTPAEEVVEIMLDYLRATSGWKGPKPKK